MNQNEYYINRCLQIAKNGLGSTRPNPMVGSVIVYNNKIIGEGYTSKYGSSHAEVNAINSVKDKSLLKKSTLFVTLEPCSHYGKTPPCSLLIVKHDIPNVVIGCIDDNEKVAGKGVALLKKNNINVTVGVLEEKCKNHHKRFFTFHNKQRPYVILKWAETEDGLIAPITKDEQKPVWITNKESRQLVHKWRAEEQAILVGTNTVEKDNPSLTTRDWKGNNPTRIIIDKDNRLNKSFSVFSTEVETHVISSNNFNFSKNLAQQICEFLFQKDINSIIIEGGKQTLQTFINENLWDEARVFYGNSTFIKGTKAPLFSGKLSLEERIKTDTLKIYIND